jgi:IS5 family transposase
MSQTTFASLAYSSKKKITRRERFLNEMELVVPWKELEAVVSPQYPDIGNGRPPIGLRRMLKIYFMQQWFNLSDPGMEDALYDSESMRRFADIELGRDAVPDETTILKFRHLLEQHDTTKELFTEVRRHLEEKGLMVREGTIVDATILDAPTSTKNAERKRDPEMRQVQKGNEWYYRMKAHVGAETSRGLVHTLVCTPANINDGKMMSLLLHGEEEEIYGDRAYQSKEREGFFTARGVRWRVARQAYRGHPISKRTRTWNRSVSRVRARGEHAFHVVKQLWGHARIRYRGIRKNAAQLFTLFALANLYLVRQKLLKLRYRCA